VLARAFDEDPFVNWMVKQDSQRARRMLTLFDTTLRRLALPRDEVYMSDNQDAVVLWLPPGKWKMGLWQQLALLPAMIRMGGIKGVSRLLTAATQMDHAHSAASHYYMLNIAVEPASQKRGLGTRIVQPILRRCDQEQIGAYLETATARDIVFHRRLGFEVIGEIPLPEGPTLSLMWRKPRSSLV
jgi:ribosomal protein S18 acetylase RimI-like enzyme